MTESKKRKKPTFRQKNAFQKIVENGGNVSKGMLDAGYSEATAKTPTKLTESKGWNTLTEKYLPDEDLAKIHKELLNKKETYIKKNNKTGKIEIIKTGEIDSQAVRAGLDMAYKLKGKYSTQKIGFIDENEHLTDEELQEELDKLLIEREKIIRKNIESNK